MRTLILGALLAASAWLVWRSLPRGGGKAGGSDAEPSLVQDPVCHTYIPKETAVMLREGDREHYFCSERCAEAFRGSDD